MAHRLVVLFGFIIAIQALPASWRYATVKRAADISAEYDYVIVGAGTAGTTVADRLSEDGSKSILLIEYGPLSTDDSFMLPWNTPSAAFKYNLTSVPQPNARNRTFAVANGAVVGGGSAVNGQVFDRGSKHDYDNWAKLSGFSEWNWDGILPYFKKSVTFVPPTQEMQAFGVTYDMDAWGGDTPVYASYPPYLYPGQKIVWDSFAEKEGVEVQKEHADGHAYGLFWSPVSVDPNSAYNRSFAGIGHYLKVQPRQNYHLLTLNRVTKVNFEREGDLQKAVSVTIQPRYGNQTTFDVKAKNEIIVSTAAVRTPVLLQLSGIGPKKLLDSANISTVVDLPGVGWNMQDHSFSYSWFNFTTDVWPTPTTIANNATFKEESIAEFRTKNTGPYTAYVVSSGAFLPASSFMGDFFDSLVEEIKAQDPAEYLPVDLPAELVAGYAKQKELLLASFQANDSALLEHLFSGSPIGTVILLKPFSRGTITLNPADPLGDPIVDYRLLTNPLDLKIHVRMAQYMRNHYATAPQLQQLGPVEFDPGPGFDTDEDVERWLIQLDKLKASNGHSCGTAALAPRELGGVVDEELKVYGTSGLSIADVSIIPMLVGSHTQSTAYAIGEKAADLIKVRNS